MPYRLQLLVLPRIAHAVASTQTQIRLTHGLMSHVRDTHVSHSTHVSHTRPHTAHGTAHTERTAREKSQISQKLVILFV